MGVGDRVQISGGYTMSKLSEALAAMDKAGDAIRASFTTFNAEDRENALDSGGLSR